MILIGMSHADADTNRFNLLTDYPPTLQTHFTYTPETPVLGRFQPYVGLQTDYSYRSLRVTDATTAARRSVVDHILAEYLYAAVGIAPHLQVGVVLPFLLQTSFIDPGPVVQPSAVHKRGISDIRFDVAYNILDQSRYPVGLSLLGFVTAPTGPESEFLGSNGVTGGGQVIVDATHWRQLHWSSAVGVRFHKQVAFENLNVGQELEFTAGGAWDFISTMSATTEFRLRSPFNNFMKNSAHTPMEARVGANWRIGQSGFTVKPGVGFGITYGSSQPLVRGLVAVSYVGTAQPPPPPHPPKPVMEVAPKAPKLAPAKVAPISEPAPAKVVEAPKVVAPEPTPAKVVEAPKVVAPEPTPAKVVEAPRVIAPEPTPAKVVEAPKVVTPEPTPAKVVEAPKIVAPEVAAPPAEVTPAKVVTAPKPAPAPTPVPEPAPAKVVAAPKAVAPEVVAHAPEVAPVPKPAPVPAPAKVVAAPKVPAPVTPALKKQAPLQPTTPIGDLPYTVKFTLGSSKLRANAMPPMDQMLSLLRDPRITLRIQGHAEPRLSALETQRMATRRARVVMRELVRRGADPARLQVVGLNGWLPAAFPDTRTSHRNIRVDFVALPDLD